MEVKWRFDIIGNVQAHDEFIMNSWRAIYVESL
jgi:hypothetical protein